MFTDLPGVTGKELAALDAYTLFESEYWQSLTSGKMRTSLELITSPSIYDLAHGQLRGNTEVGTTIGGTTRFAVTGVDSSGPDEVVVRACQDTTDWIVTQDDGSTAPGFGRSTVVVSLVHPPNQLWAVSSYEGGEPC